MLSGRYTNFNFCSMAGIAGVAESIIMAIQDLKTSMCIVHCYICATGGTKQDLIIAGCHSGNFMTLKPVNKSKKENVPQAHQNLIRVLISLSTLKHKYFVSADVCGYVKLWTSNIKP